MTPATILFESLIALLKVAGPGLYRGAFTAVVEAVTGTASLLDPVTTGHRTRGPFRPRRPSIICVVARPAPRAALPIRHGGIGARHERTGHFPADSGRVLASTFSAAVNSPLIFIFVQDSIMNARSRSDLDYFGNDFIFFSHFANSVLKCCNHGP